MEELPWDLKGIIYKYLCVPNNILNEIHQDRQENIIMPKLYIRGTIYKCIYRHYSRTLNFFCVTCGNIFSSNKSATPNYSNHIICRCGNNEWLYLNSDKRYKQGFKLKR